MSKKVRQYTLKRFMELYPLMAKYILSKVKGIDTEDEEYYVRTDGSYMEIGYLTDEWKLKYEPEKLYS